MDDRAFGDPRTGEWSSPPAVPPAGRRDEVGDEQQVSTMTEQEPDRSAIDPRANDAALLEVFRRYRETGDPALRDELVVAHRWIAAHAARRFANRGEPVDDLVQVGSVGLIKAVERFDPELGHGFVSFAMPTIIGEIKRYFRDHTWSTHVPRRAKDLRPKVQAAVEQLTGELGRSPRVSEVAALVGVDESLVVETLEASNAYRAASIHSRDDGGEDRFASALATIDPDLRTAVDRQAIQQLLATLGGRERQIVYLRFFEQMSQSEIAEVVGVSQVHVGRLLTQSLARLREHLT